MGHLCLGVCRTFQSFVCVFVSVMFIGVWGGGMVCKERIIFIFVWQLKYTRSVMIITISRKQSDPGPYNETFAFIFPSFSSLFLKTYDLGLSQWMIECVNAFLKITH